MLWKMLQMLAANSEDWHVGIPDPHAQVSFSDDGLHALDHRQTDLHREKDYCHLEKHGKTISYILRKIFSSEHRSYTTLQPHSFRRVQFFDSCAPGFRCDATAATHQEHHGLVFNTPWGLHLHPEHHPRRRGPNSGAQESSEAGQLAVPKMIWGWSP